ncbi:MAG: hypothetical protein FWG11_08965 [Promicromonosporaceae bacterium]|nr:hypothetical protein [Promicromonosporaceae bacterium]
MPATRNWRTTAIRTVITFLVAALVLPLGILTIGVLANGRTAANPTGASFAPLRGLDLGGGTQTRIAVGDEAPAYADVVRSRLSALGRYDTAVSVDGGDVLVAHAGPQDWLVSSVSTQPGELTFRPVLLVDWGFPFDMGLETEDGTETGDEPVSDDEGVEDGEAEEPAGEAPIPTNPADPAWETTELRAAFDELTCLEPHTPINNPALPLLACSADRMTKYLLGPVVVNADQLTSVRPFATPMLNQDGTVADAWGLDLRFDDAGTQAMADITRLLAADGDAVASNQLALVLDSEVLEAPGINETLDTGTMVFSGNFTELGARQIVAQINHRLPAAAGLEAAFETTEIGPTIAGTQLNRAVLALAVGLVLVIAFLIWQYRALGLLALGALVVAGVSTYAIYALLSWWSLTRISVPVVLGFLVGGVLVVASVLTYVGRMRAALRNGRTVSYAVDSAWGPSLRTIFVANVAVIIITIIGAGFATGTAAEFSTAVLLLAALNLVVTAWFVRPLLQLLAARPSFEAGAPFSGLKVRADVAELDAAAVLRDRRKAESRTSDRKHKEN